MIFCHNIVSIQKLIRLLAGGVNGVVFTSARLFATGAQDGNLPSFFSLVHYKQQTPIPSLIFSVRQCVNCSIEGIKSFRFQSNSKKSNVKLYNSMNFSVNNLADNALHIKCVSVDQLLQPNFMVICCGQHCCFTLVEKD